MNDFDRWLNTEEGAKCLDKSILSQHPKAVGYLRNRLWYAFQAGKSTLPEPPSDQAQRIIRKLIARIPGKLSKEFQSEVNKILYNIP